MSNSSKKLYLGRISQDGLIKEMRWIRDPEGYEESCSYDINNDLLLIAYVDSRSEFYSKLKSKFADAFKPAPPVPVTATLTMIRKEHFSLVQDTLKLFMKYAFDGKPYLLATSPSWWDLQIEEFIKLLSKEEQG